MCGIFGYWSFVDEPREFLRKMAEKQRHRGPDDEGFYWNKSAGIGQRRLSIIDLSTGHQPICNEDKSIRIITNGEIYNYRELNEELRSRGHVFSTSSDAECVIHLYEETGIDCLKKLNGMFSLVILDDREKCMYIARDRLGIKPLYYAVQNGDLFFSSELRSLFATGRIMKDINWEAISTFFDLMYIPTPLTPFREIRKLAAGSYIKVNEGGIGKEERYWRLQDAPSLPIPTNEADAVEQLREILIDAARLQLRADVPICSFLSGGIDSSAVTAFAAMESTKQIDTYHVYFANSTGKEDERRYARLVAERYGTNHYEVDVVKEDFVRLIPRIIWHLEEPFCDLASIPTYVISEMARKRVTVCLNGSGGDELFVGYPHHRPQNIKDKLIRILDSSPFKYSLRKMLGAEKDMIDTAKLFPLLGKSQTFQEDMYRSFPGDHINKILAKDIDGYLQSNVLFLLDKVSMSLSLEGRVPLLDHRFVELAAHLPGAMKYGDGSNKYLFRKILKPYLPSEVLNKGKEGFGAPMGNWMDAEIRHGMMKLLGRGSLRKNGYLNYDKKELNSLSPWGLWKVVNLELWHQIVVESDENPKDRTLLEYF